MSHRIAVSVLLTKDFATNEVLLVERNPELRFMGGYYAFPGGTLDDADGEIEVQNLEREEVGPFIVAAAREMLEEVGTWLVRGPRPSAERLATWRRQLLEDSRSFASLLEESGGYLDGRDFEPIGRIKTPPFAPRRYDTWFLACRLPPGDEVEIWPGELVAGSFVRADEALSKWKMGNQEIVPPVLIFLMNLAESTITSGLPEVKRLTASFVAGDLHPVYFSPGVLLAPLEARTKPPATHTNAYVVGEDYLYLIDPAAVDEGEQERLWALIDGLLTEDRELRAVLLTHAHPDHVGAVAAAQRRYGVPLWAHSATAPRLPDGARLDRCLEEGDRLELGLAPDGSPGWCLEVFEMPGHAPDHLTFRETRYGAMVVGDLVSTLSSVLIEPGEGHLRTYLDSLERLRELCGGTLYPGHGPPGRVGRKVVEHQIHHRMRRESQLVDALRQECRTPRSIVEKTYTDVDRRFWPMAERSVLAGLVKLQEDGLVTKGPDGFELVEEDGSAEEDPVARDC